MVDIRSQLNKITVGSLGEMIREAEKNLSVAQSKEEALNFEKIANIHLSNHEDRLSNEFEKSVKHKKKIRYNNKVFNAGAPFLCNGQPARLAPLGLDVYVVLHEKPIPLTSNLVLIARGIKQESRWAQVRNPIIRPCTCRGTLHSECYPRKRFQKKVNNNGSQYQADLSTILAPTNHD